MWNLAATLSYLLWVDMDGYSTVRSRAYTTAHLNIIVTSVWSLWWGGVHIRQSARGSAWPRSNAFLKSQTLVVSLAALSLLGAADLRLFFDPWNHSELADSFGGIIGLLAVTLSMLAYARIREARLENLRTGQFGVGLLAIGSLMVCVVSRVFTDEWRAYHAMMAMVSLSAMLMLAIRWRALGATLEPRAGASTASSGMASRLRASVAHIGDQRSLERWVAALACAHIVMLLRGGGRPGSPGGPSGLGFRFACCLPA
jgi:hypothetical protein